MTNRLSLFMDILQTIGCSRIMSCNKSKFHGAFQRRGVIFSGEGRMADHVLGLGMPDSTSLVQRKPSNW